MQGYNYRWHVGVIKGSKGNLRKKDISCLRRGHIIISPAWHEGVKVWLCETNFEKLFSLGLN